MEKENQIRSGEAMFGLVNSECLPDRMSGERLNTFANSERRSRKCKNLVFEP